MFGDEDAIGAGGAGARGGDGGAAGAAGTAGVENEVVANLLGGSSANESSTRAGAKRRTSGVASVELSRSERWKDIVCKGL